MAVKLSKSSNRPHIYIGAWIVIIFGSFFLLEILVRIALPDVSIEKTRKYSLEYLPTVYARHRLDPQGRLIDVDSNKALGTKEESEFTKRKFYISERGYRGPEFDVVKPLGTQRVIVLGGSSVFDTQVADTLKSNKNSWPHKMEAILHEEGYVDVEVINAGVPGHAIMDSLGRLMTEIWYYQPDYILIYHGWNDLKHFKNKPVSPQNTLFKVMKPYDSKANPFKNHQGALDEFASYSQFYMRVRNIYLQWKIDIGQEGLVMSSDEEQFSDNYSSYGLKQYKLGIETFIEFCHLIGAKPIIVSQSTLIHTDNTDADKDRINFKYQKLNHIALLKGYSEIYSVLKEVTQVKDIPYINAASKMNGRSELFADHVHLSEEGSAFLAAFVADGIKPYIASR